MNLWNFHDKKMHELYSLYNKQNNSIKNKIQLYLDSFNINSNNLYSMVSLSDKKRINNIITEWKENDIVKGYSKYLASYIYNRSNVTYREVLELLVYGAYLEAIKNYEDKEKEIIKEDINNYYIEGQKEVLKSKKIDDKWDTITDVLFFMLLNEQTTLGYNFHEYKTNLYSLNSKEILKQILLNISNNKELKIDSDEFKNIFKRQLIQQVNIKDSSISGAMDNILIGLNNKAKIKGIEYFDKEAQVRFLAITDEKSTEMCQSLKNQLFYINKENEFYRMYGETAKVLNNQKIRCFGLVLGLNLPPINHHFHWCRSTITYLTEYNSKDVEKMTKNKSR